MNRPRLIRGLRIAWSVWWGIVCVLLIVLWVRSYCYQWEVVRVYLSSHYRYDLLARKGCVEVTKHYSGTIAFDLGFDSAPYKRDSYGNHAVYSGLPPDRRWELSKGKRICNSLLVPHCNMHWCRNRTMDSFAELLASEKCYWL